MFRKLAIVGAFATNVVNGLSPKYLPCQTIEPPPASPVTGCPPGTVYVSATDSRAKYKSVQDAVLAMSVLVTRCSTCEIANQMNSRGNNPGDAHILVGQGRYYGTVNVTRQSPLTLLVSH
jgi:hypothetical protein